MNFEYSLAPIFYNLSDNEVSDFYKKIEKIEKLKHISIGETVCTKRAINKQSFFYKTAEFLAKEGKKVYISTPALIMDKDDINYTTKLIKNSAFPIEANDLTSISLCIEHNKEFSVGSFVNTYNEDTLKYFFEKGALKVSLPFELPLDSAKKIASTTNNKVEFTAYGKVPLSISARCYHAKHYSKNKQNCAFECNKHKTGMKIYTIENKKILLVNGTMVVSPQTTNLLEQKDLFANSNINILKIIPDDLNKTLSLLNQIE